MTANGGPREGSERPPGHAPGTARRRPRWATVLAVLMLLAGARLFFGGLTDLRRVATGQSMMDVRVEGLGDANQELLIRGQLALQIAVEHAHPTASAVQAGYRFLLSLLFLFAVVAVFSDDARARKATVAAAWGGMVLNLGVGIFIFLVVRQSAGALVPVLEEVAAKVQARTGEVPPVAGDLTHLTSTLVVQIPLFITLLGFLFSVLLLVYFSGRRGRLFYNRGEQAHHG